MLQPSVSTSGIYSTFLFMCQHPQPLQPLFPLQKNRSRITHRQLSFPQPQPQLEFPFPQQLSRRRIHRILHPQEFPFPLNSPLFPESHPHPQFVAVKSLMLNPPIRLLFTVLYYAGGGKVFLMDRNRDMRIF